MPEDPSDHDDREHRSDSTPDRSSEDAGFDGASTDTPRSGAAVPTPEDVRDELYGGRGEVVDRPIEGFDEGIVELLAWGLDTEIRARIYVRLRQHPRATSEELAADTGLYPSIVRTALTDLHDEGVVEHHERVGDSKDEPEYTAIAPSDLVGKLAERAQERFDAVFDFGPSPRRDSGRDAGRDTTSPRSTTTPATEPVTITVRDASDTGASDAGGDDTGHHVDASSDSTDPDDDVTADDGTTHDDPTDD